MILRRRSLRVPGAVLRALPALLAAGLLLAGPAAAAPAASGSPAAPDAKAFGAEAAGTDAPETWVRVGVIVASRRGLPEDQPLRFAYQDADKLERLLATVGQVDPDNLFSLKAEEREGLRRGIARAGARVEALKRQGRRVFLQFYYTGHGAARRFHLADGPLAFDEVKEALGGSRVDARVYVLDVCYGASFFTAKGFRTAPPLQLQLDLDRSARGEVVISSSASDEQAYEVRSLGGSIFTSHWIMALRGAGDRNRDGQVTLFEAYNYAYDRTSGYSAETLARPQHPSFQMDLTGARDMQLARLLRTTSGILLRNCPAGNYHVLDLGRGHPIGELRVPDGEEFTLALERGRYRVQYLPARGRALAADVDLPAAGITALPFSAFSPQTAEEGSGKGPLAPPPGEADGPEGSTEGTQAPDAGPGPAGLRPARGGGLSAGDRWTLTGTWGPSWFHASGLASNLEPEDGSDAWFGTGGGIDAPSFRNTAGFDLAYSPAAPWSLGLRLGGSRFGLDRSATGTEPLASVSEGSQGRYPVRLASSWEVSDFHYGFFLSRSFRIPRGQALALDLGAGFLRRRAKGTRVLRRELYDSEVRTSDEAEGEGWRLEAGLTWAWSRTLGPKSRLGLGVRLAPYLLSIEDTGAPAHPAVGTREAGLGLGFTASLGRLRAPAGRTP